MEVAALDKTIRVTSALKIKQVGDTVHIEADEGVEINGGGSYSHFRDGVIEEGTAGEYVVHSNGVVKEGAQSLAVTPMAHYTAEPHYLQYVVRDFQGQPLANKPYVLMMADGTFQEGITNAQGQTQQVTTHGPETVNLYVEDPSHQGFLVDIQEKSA
jgi:uncharacterized protein (DUF2345 family)